VRESTPLPRVGRLSPLEHAKAVTSTTSARQ
jgi:hypothetical protein